MQLPILYLPRALPICHTYIPFRYYVLLANVRCRKVFDPTESAGLGLLNEMSLVETKVRLEANERRRAEAEAAKRREILLQRAEREADLRER